MFSIIVCTDLKNGIGKNNTLPWKNKKDMKFFKEKTNFNIVIMGKNTYLSLPNGYLKDRVNIVISSCLFLKNDKNIVVMSSLDNALKYCSSNYNHKRIFIIGGSMLYKEALIHKNLEYIYWNILLEKSDYDCDIFFPISLEECINTYNIKEFSTKDEIEFYEFNCNQRLNCGIKNDEQIYLHLLKKIYELGDERQTRNAITKSLFGEKLEFDLHNNVFPLLTTKKMFLRGIFEELIWFLKGETNSKMLEEKKVNIWKKNSSKEFLESMNLNYEEGDIGNMYGFQWNHYGTEYLGCKENYEDKGFNQIEYCLNLLKKDKFSRRIIMTTYSPSEANKGVLYPCHGLIVQWYVKEVNQINYLSCHMYQRSADAFLGVPFNISSYSLLTYLFCEILNNDNLKFKPDKLIISFGDIHIYEDHYKQIKEQINRKPYCFPKLFIKNKKSLKDFEWSDIEIKNYKYHEKIIAKMIA